jgi:hypothetical protein
MVTTVANGSSCLSTASRAGSTLPNPMRRCVFAPGTEPPTDPTTAATLTSPAKKSGQSVGFWKLSRLLCLSHFVLYFERALLMAHEE